ncbi:MAG: insulinase family protein, partial [Gemmatimonadetes bacterium]|nr:insulinase family protein [Gemmatimonadota bacterium]NIQ55150.1 insulinase family protein [Gemmatimonadota bacterium]NIU75352.1 insulinase family protein [Gammaproteobacteria bacterium]NIX45124.1 insulinase family protein [Gemmatimonadota bacterium]NIY09375.1 insulinase family protein [Gemmatimonadota bacterium]
MRRRPALTALALALAFAGCAGGAQPPEPANPPPTPAPEEAMDVPRLVTLQEPGSPFIAFNIWVRAGSQNDPEGKEGLAALTARVLADGSTRDRS